MQLLEPITLRLSTPSDRRGTAFLLQSQYLMTAAHCVDQNDCQTGVSVELSGKQLLCDVLWVSEPKTSLDAAILKIRVSQDRVETPSRLLVGTLPTKRLSTNLRWHAFGYPLADPEQLGLDLTGSIAGVQEAVGYRRLQLNCDQFGADGSGLKGASGSPVTVNAHTVAFISRAPTQFKQRVLYATMVEDALKEFFRSGPKSDVEVVQAIFSSIPQIELDECDKALNRYLASLLHLGSAFHEQGIVTPLCTTRSLQSSSLESSYVKVALQKKSRVQDFWVDANECPPAANPTMPETQMYLDEAVSNSAQANGFIQLLVTGYAGAGKTTLLNYIAVKALYSPKEIGLSEPMLPLVLALPELAKVKCLGSFSDWLEKTGAKGVDATTAFFHYKYFDDFSTRMSAPWLLLLDGFDEVPDPLRKDLLRSFRMCVIENRINWCLSSRPATNLNDQIIDISQSRGVQSYKILPWTDQEVGHLAAYLLDDRHVPDFVDQFKAVTLDRSAITPLLALIALCVYRENLNTLPTTRAELYELFVDNALLRALRRRGESLIPRWIRPDDRDLLIEILSQIGLLSARDPAQDRIEGLVEWVQASLQEIEPMPSRRGLKCAREFVEWVAAGSGLIILDKGQWRWWHASVRDYFAAYALANGPQDSQLLTLELYDTSIWKEIIVLMMSILSVRHRRNPERNADVTQLFRQLSETHDDCGLLLYIALSEGAVVDDDMELFVIESLVSGAMRMGSDVNCKAYNDELESQGRSPVELLARMSDRPAAVSGLMKIRDAAGIEPWMRSQAERVLKRRIRGVQ
jgi:hypothetical protein